MIEILVLLWYTGKIGKIVEAKGYKPGKYKWMTAGLWFGGEIIGAILGALMASSSSDTQCIAYAVALIGAAIGAAIAYAIANNLEPLPGYPLPAAGTVVAELTPAQKLDELQQMMSSGQITPEEYEKKRTEILSRM